MLEWSDVILGVFVGALLGGAVAAAWFLARRATGLAELANAQARAALLDEQARQQVVEIERARAESDVIDQAREDAERRAAVLAEQVRQFGDEETRLAATFGALGAKALNANNEQFLTLANEKLTPFKELLDQQKKQVDEIEQKRERAYGSIEVQIQAMTAAHGELRAETGRLVSALRRPEVRGRWGESQLRRVAELTGMIDRCDFTEQQTLETADGRLRPDMLVHLPNDRTIAVDAKTPLDAVLDALECDDDLARGECLDRFIHHIETQVKALSSKQYWAALDQSPDFVILFIPGESFLQAAAQKKRDLLEAAMARNVVIASPNTLFSLLKVIALGWREQALAENAARISDLGIELHERLCTALGYAKQLGDSMNASVRHYEGFVGSVESRVLVSGRRLEELGAKSKKDLLDALPDVPTITRLPTQGDALDRVEAKGLPAASQTNLV